MIKLPKGYILLPVKCKTDEYSSIEENIEKGILPNNSKTQKQLEEAVEIRISRLNIEFISGYYSKNDSYEGTLIELVTGSTITTPLSVEKIDNLLIKNKPNIKNLWGILL